MVKPQEIRLRLIRQWENPKYRVERILGDRLPEAIKIREPSPKEINEGGGEVNLEVGKIIAEWKSIPGVLLRTEPKKYKTLELEQLPESWIISSLQEWAEACQNEEISNQILTLKSLLEITPPLYHEFLVRKKHFWCKLEKPIDSMLVAVEVAESLSRGCCDGAPLRSYPVAGHVGTKFIEDHKDLITSLLDLRYDGEVRAIGLDKFLNTASEGSRWALLVDFNSNTLPIQKMRVRTSDLILPFTTAKTVLIIENEQCLHLLPPLEDTLIISGAGIDLGWTSAEWLKERTVYYWGDIDTWGLSMLSTVRKNLPKVHAALMTLDLVEQFHAQTTKEEKNYPGISLEHLTEKEHRLFTFLKSNNLRLEQEFLSKDVVWNALKNCANS